MLRFSAKRVCTPGLRRWLATGPSTSLLALSAEVEHALHVGQAVVALETAVVSHGLPAPHSLELPLACEALIRKRGAVPATIGVIEGRIHVGLSEVQIARLADGDSRVERRKLSRRDLAAAIAQRVDGGTTVAATMAIAARAGVRVFATGGIGGVHRGGQHSMDVSADLVELRHSQVGVVSSGVKSILDIGRTLEYLETQGVPVATLGPTADFPAFYSPRSGHRSPVHVRSPDDAAELLRHQFALDLGGALIAVPIPAEHETTAEAIQAAVEQAVAESEANGVAARGKEVTPWLLARVAELTRGSSVQSNLALLQSNADVAAQIAVELSGPPRPSQHQPAAVPAPLRPPEPAATPSRAKIVVVGVAALDITARAVLPLANTTSPGTVQMTLGGVGRNVAEAATRLSADRNDVKLIASTASDPLGAVVRLRLAETGMRTDGLIDIGASGRTPTCSIVLDHTGQLIGGVANMDSADIVDVDALRRSLGDAGPRLIVFDGNVSSGVISALLSLDVPTLFECTSDSKATGLLPAFASGSTVDYATPNTYELRAMFDAGKLSGLFETPAFWTALDALGIDGDFSATLPTRLPPWIARDGLVQMAAHLLPFIGSIFVKCGARGLLIATKVPAGSHEAWDDLYARRPPGLAMAKSGTDGSRTVFRYYPGLPLESAAGVSAVGAGDTLAGAIAVMLADGRSLHRPRDMDAIAQAAQRAAILTLQSSETVSPLLSPALLQS